MLLRKLHEADLLGRAQWSLSTPAQCAPTWTPTLREPGRRVWRPFCRLFPKQLDRPLRGELEESDKDSVYPPRALYAKTRFSIVFESVVSSMGDRGYPPFLTEKVLKPLALGHPFLLLCAAPATWAILRALGFRSFAPTMSDELTDRDYTEFPCDKLDEGTYANDVIAEVTTRQSWA